MPTSKLNKRPHNESIESPTDAVNNKRGARGRPRNKDAITDKCDDGKKGLTEAIYKSDILRRIKDFSTPLEVLTHDSPQEIVGEWIGHYKQDREEALVELLGVFVAASGCSGMLTVKLYNEMSCSDVIRRLGEEFTLETADYPVMTSGYHWKKFRAHFCSFVSMLIEHSKQAIIYDQYLMRKIVSFLTELSDSTLRPFRHTSTLALMKTMTGLVEISVGIVNDVEIASRQLETENIKVSKQKPTERIKTLKARLKSLNDQQTEITDIRNYIFKHVFVQRYRDVVPDIRIICLSELARWIMAWPTEFINDHYLKYIGWNIFDRVGDVRLTCLRSLQPMYESAETNFGLDQFTNQFKARIIQMAYDKDPDVAVQAVRTVIAMFRCDPSFITLEECSGISKQVFGVNRNVARAAGEFLNVIIQQRIDHQNIHVVLKSGKTLSKTALALYEVICYHMYFQYFDYTAYLVETLFDCCLAMRDWKTMTDLLLDEPVDPQYALCDHSESVLIEIMVLCIKQACNTGITQKKLSVKDMRQLETVRTALSEHFILNLSHLCAKFIVDEKKIAHLLGIMSELDTSLFSNGEFAQRLEEFLKLLEEIIEKNMNEQVLENCSKAYMFLCLDTCCVTSSCQVSKNTAIGQIADNFTVAYHNFFYPEHPQCFEDVSFALFSSLKKILAFNCFHDLSSCNLSPYLFSIMRRAQNCTTIPAEILVESIRVAYMSICWFYQSVKMSAVPDDVIVLQGQISDLISNCEFLMSYHDDAVAEESYLLLSDLLVVFGPCINDEDTSLHPLCVVPTDSLRDTLIDFLRSRVFSENDSQETNCERIRTFLLAYCKFILFGVLSFKYAVIVLIYYAKFYDVFGDIIKLFIAKLRGIDQILAAKLMIATLIEFYRNISEDEVQLRELSRKFAAIYRINHKNTREAVAAIHQRGIKFALSSEEVLIGGKLFPNISFFDVIADFTSKVAPSDRTAILDYLDTQLLNMMVDPQDPDYPSLTNYRKFLVVTDLSSDVLSTISPLSAKRNPNDSVEGPAKKLTNISGIPDFGVSMMHSLSSLPSSQNTPAGRARLGSILEVGAPFSASSTFTSNRSINESEDDNISSILSNQSLCPDDSL